MLAFSLRDFLLNMVWLSTLPVSFLLGARSDVDVHACTAQRAGNATPSSSAPSNSDHQIGAQTDRVSPGHKHLAAKLQGTTGYQNMQDCSTCCHLELYIVCASLLQYSGSVAAEAATGCCQR